MNFLSPSSICPKISSLHCSFSNQRNFSMPFAFCSFPIKYSSSLPLTKSSKLTHVDSSSFFSPAHPPLCYCSAWLGASGLSQGAGKITPVSQVYLCKVFPLHFWAYVFCHFKHERISLEVTSHYLRNKCEAINIATVFGFFSPLLQYKLKLELSSHEITC